MGMENIAWDTAHITRISGQGVYGHPGSICDTDPGGSCAGINEYFYEHISPEEVELHHCYTLDADGCVTGEIDE